jgi:hypothetical protein
MDALTTGVAQVSSVRWPEAQRTFVGRPPTRPRRFSQRGRHEGVDQLTGTTDTRAEFGAALQWTLKQCRWRAPRVMA